MGLKPKKASLDLRDLRGVPIARRSCRYQADESSDPVWETIRSVKFLTLNCNTLLNNTLSIVVLYHGHAPGPGFGRLPAALQAKEPYFKLGMPQTWRPLP